MEWLGPVLVKLFDKFDVITLFSLLLISGCGYYHIIWRREEREDRAKMMEAFNKNSEAIASLKNILSAITGRPV